MMDENISAEVRRAQNMVLMAEHHVKRARNELARARGQLRRAKLKPEAIVRMNRLGIRPDIVDDFRLNDTVVAYSADFDIFLSPGSEEQTIIRKLEHDFAAMVYFMFTQTVCFEPGAVFLMESFLYVSPDVVQLEHDSPIYGPNFVFAYTHNYDSPIDSEHSDLPVQRTPSGGLRRLTLNEQYDPGSIFR